MFRWLDNWMQRWMERMDAYQLGYNRGRTSLTSEPWDDDPYDDEVAEARYRRGLADGARDRYSK
jgi:hypothetical protein